jgi:hypothetical protein
MCGLSANQQFISYFDDLHDCLNTLIVKQVMNGLTSPLLTASQNQLQNHKLKTQSLAACIDYFHKPTV